MFEREPYLNYDFCEYSDYFLFNSTSWKYTIAHAQTYERHVIMHYHPLQASHP